jgi:chemotaxis protein methyltransferase CheR
MAFTFFFRDLQTLQYVTEHVIPKLKGRSYINIWDAGCAMGPEPYTLAIILRENMGQFMYRNVRIYATDIDEQDTFGPTIVKGIYPYDMLKRIPNNIFESYFSKADANGDYVIREDIRKAVEFQKHDILSLKPIRENLGMIVCKNVLLHFNYAKRVEVYKMYHHALADDGYLVNEHTQKLPKEVGHMFEQILPNAQIFKKIPS